MNGITNITHDTRIKECGTIQFIISVKQEIINIEIVKMQVTYTGI
jgi:hypothetical protein